MCKLGFVSIVCLVNAVLLVLVHQGFCDDVGELGVAPTSTQVVNITAYECDCSISTMNQCFCFGFVVTLRYTTEWYTALDDVHRIMQAAFVQIMCYGQRT